MTTIQDLEKHVNQVKNVLSLDHLNIKNTKIAAQNSVAHSKHLSNLEKLTGEAEQNFKKLENLSKSAGEVLKEMGDVHHWIDRMEAETDHLAAILEMRQSN